MSADNVPGPALEALLGLVKFNDKGLLCAVAQDYESGAVLMQAWMNREALALSVKTGKAHYYSRSRDKLWLKGESSGHTQEIREIRIDCDGDTLLLRVDQHGAACHEGYASCFFRRLTPEGFETVGERVFDPKAVYGKSD